MIKSRPSRQSKNQPARLISYGRLDVITGPMFSGKSEELVKRLQRYKIAGLKTVVFNHVLDNRYVTNRIVSHSKRKWRAVSIQNPENILNKIDKNTKVVVIDEVQFFPKTIIGVVNQLLQQHIHVVVAGLDTDFRGEPFGVMPQLLALADGEVVKLKAVCAVCKKWNATRTQRLSANGKPASHRDALIKVGAWDSYQARCRIHHIVL